MTNTTATAPDFATIVVVEATAREAAHRVRAMGNYGNGEIHHAVIVALQGLGVSYADAGHEEIHLATMRGIAAAGAARAAQQPVQL